MSAFPQPKLPPLAADLAEGLSAEPKYIPSRYLYDEIGISLHEIATRLPEYGDSRAEERILRRHSYDLAEIVGAIPSLIELGLGNPRAAAHLARGLTSCHSHSLSIQSLETDRVSPNDWLETAMQATHSRPVGQPLLLMLQGNSVGSIERSKLHDFLRRLRSLMRPGDYFLFGADLVKEIDKMLLAYNDSAGVFSAFNKNLLSRINRELCGHFNISQFDHHVRWNGFFRRIELHLLTWKDQQIYIGELGRRFHLNAGESIMTECAYKLSELDLEAMAGATGFNPVKTWIDIEWAFAEALWTI